MESRVGWHRALLAAQNYDTVVLYGAPFSEEELRRLKDECKLPKSLTFMKIEHSRLAERWIEFPLCFYTVYSAWQRRAFARAFELHRELGFDFVHQVNFCGYREPGLGYKLNVPFVWGPIGGTSNYPLRFLTIADFWGGARELIRNAINLSQLKYSKRVRRAAQSSAKIFVANTAGKRDFQDYVGVETTVQLEIGINSLAPSNKPLRSIDDPLKILWAGRLRTWKGLPLLLRGLAKLPADVPFEVRILGVGDCLGRWQRLAKRLGIASKIEWLGWPTYDETLPHYDWADVLAFTSLRDTSGTGILEALAAGTPIVGVDHQGLADIIDETCGIPIPVSSPKEVFQGFCDALHRLSASPELLQELSNGALACARNYLWQNLDKEMQSTYRSLLNQSPSPTDSVYSERQGIPISSPQTFS